MPYKVLVVCCLAVVGLLAPQTVLAQTDRNVEPPAETTIVIRRCVITYERSTMLGTSTSAALRDCLVQLGQEVKAQQKLGHLDDREFRAAMELYSVEAASDVKIRIAESEHEGTQVVVRSQEELRKRG